MPLTVSNPGLARLLQQRGGLERADIACACQCAPDTVTRWAAGAHYPVFEQRLAAFLRLSVPDLRARVGLDKPKPRRSVP
jgi:hypothetical protein